MLVQIFKKTHFILFNDGIGFYQVCHRTSAYISVVHEKHFCHFLIISAVKLQKKYRIYYICKSMSVNTYRTAEKT